MSEWGPSNFEEFLRRVNRELKKSQRSAIGAVNRADTAQGTADEAQGTATDAAAAAAAAASAASAATDAASGAQQTANGAVTAAGTAKTAADAAKTAADNAASAASTAQTAANTAKTTADNAASAAAAAAGVAGGKADVLIQSTTPTAAFQKSTTLWIDTTNGANTPKRWSGSAWVIVTDKAATDAAAAAAAASTAAGNAQTTANGAASAAAAAQTSANTAQSAADAAKATADAAQTKANQAATAASTAQTAADNAQSTANTAITNAGTAKTTADNAASAAAAAAGVANGKADVLIQSTTPTADYQKSTTLWVDTTNGANTPKRWNGTTWAAVTDKAATDAATAAANAASLAGTKADVLIQSATPAATYQKATTLWIDTTNSANTPKRWNGTTWVATTDKAATDAAAAATAASNLAGSKADVLIQSTAPAAAMQKATTLWIDTTNNANTPKRWNGTTWVVVTDKAATDAASAAAAAQSAANAAQGTANQAVSDAAAAQTTANQAAQSAAAAQAAATNAQSSANGKNTIKFRTAAPTTSAADKGVADGDLWFVIPNVQTGIATGQYVWMAATQTWVQQTLSSAIIASIDAAKITTGTLTGITITGVTITGTTVTGGVVQTSATGKRVVLSNNRVNFYGVDGTTDVNAGVIEGIPNGAAGGLMNFASGTGGTVFLQLGTQALPTAGSAQVYAPGVSWFPTIYTSAVYDAGTGARAPLGDSGWITPTISNALADASLPPRYRLVNGVVYFDGLLTLTSSSLNATIFQLLAGFRPAVAREVWANRGSASEWVVRIQAGGNVATLGPSGGSGQLQMASIPPFPVG